MLEDATTEWVAEARHLTPLPPPPEEARPRPRLRDAQRALVFALLGVVCFGFVFGPLALRFGRDARIGLVSGAYPADAVLAHAAESIGKVGMAVHLAIAATVLPWLLFMLPFFGG